MIFKRWITTRVIEIIVTIIIIVVGLSAKSSIVLDWRRSSEMGSYRQKNLTPLVSVKVDRK